jgi:hypothetical protein
VETRADGYAGTRTADELTRVRDDLAMTRAQASPAHSLTHSLTDRLAAAYGHALGAETDRRDWEGFRWLS